MFSVLLLLLFLNPHDANTNPPHTFVSEINERVNQPLASQTSLASLPDWMKVVTGVGYVIATTSSARGVPFSVLSSSALFLIALILSVQCGVVNEGSDEEFSDSECSLLKT